jgi:hypothetical protein
MLEIKKPSLKRRLFCFPLSQNEVFQYQQTKNYSAHTEELSAP